MSEPDWGMPDYSVSSGFFDIVMRESQLSRCVTIHGTSSHFATPISMMSENVMEMTDAKVVAIEQIRILKTAVTTKIQKYRSFFRSNLNSSN